MKTVFNNIHDISKLFIAQTQHFAGTPLTYIQGQGKGRRFYFKGDTIYSYRDSYPLAKIIGDKLYIKEEIYSNTTKKHRDSVLLAGIIRFRRNQRVNSDDLKNPNSNDVNIKKQLDKIFNATKHSNHYRKSLVIILNNKHQPITKSKFPLFFNKKHDKLKQMFFSNDVETFNLAKQIIKQEKLI